MGKWYVVFCIIVLLIFLLMRGEQGVKQDNLGGSSNSIVGALSSFLGVDVSPTKENAHRHKELVRTATDRIYNFITNNADEIEKELGASEDPQAIRAMMSLRPILEGRKTSKFSKVTESLLGALPSPKFPEAGKVAIEKSGLSQVMATVADRLTGGAGAMGGAGGVEEGTVAKMKEKITPDMGEDGSSANDLPLNLTAPVTEGDDSSGAAPVQPVNLAEKFAKLEPFKDLIHTAASDHNLEPTLLSALIYQESKGDPNISSKKGATGLTQLMPGTAKELGVTDRKDPAQSINGGAKYLSKQVEDFGNLRHALIAYNWGPGNARKWLKKGADESRLPEETQDYIKKILGDFTALG